MKFYKEKIFAILIEYMVFIFCSVGWLYIKSNALRKQRLHLHLNSCFKNQVARWVYKDTKWTQAPVKWKAN